MARKASASPQAPKPAVPQAKRARKPSPDAAGVTTHAEPLPAYGAQDAVPPPEVIAVHARRIACDGVGGALGHPRVWLEMGAAGMVECPYCDRRFVVAGGEVPESERLAPGVYEGASGH